MSQARSPGTRFLGVRRLLRLDLATLDLATRALATLVLHIACFAPLIAQAPAAPAKPPAKPAAAPTQQPKAQPAKAQPPQAQQSAATRTSFTAPDGSRFVLIQDAAMSQVEWAVATSNDPQDEPPGLEGLTAAVANSSMLGTWSTGSIDPIRERKVLADLDQAFADLLAAPQNADLRARMAAAQGEALALSDTEAFARVLATLPANRPEVTAKDGVCLLQLTTLPETIGAVGELLVERREQQALRDVGKLWMREVVARQSAYDANPASTVYAELLALALPNQPASRAAERAGRSMPRRDQAMAVWQATQRPERTVHVLLGNIDLASTKATLTRVFAKTTLPAEPRPPAALLRPIQSVRRSTVPGTRTPMVAFAWVLPEIQDPFVLEVAARWFGDGPDSWLGRELLAAGYKTCQVSCRAPWPPTIGGRSLMLVEVRDPAGSKGLADAALAAASKALKQTPSPADMNRITTSLQLAWTTVTADPRWQAGELARAALLWPQREPPLSVRENTEPQKVQQMLQGIFAGQPVVVEGRQ